MNAPARPLATETADAVIVGAEITAGHDGSADLVLQVRYENGVVAPVVLDQDTAFDLMAACGAASLEALVGRCWRDFFGTTGVEGL
jgi:hypothetical protein